MTPLLADKIGVHRLPRRIYPHLTALVALQQRLHHRINQP